MYRAYLQTEIGLLEITGTDKGIAAVRFVEQAAETAGNAASCVRRCQAELAEYFAGERQHFTVSLLPQGTLFQRMVWDRLRDIPYGGKISYRQLAAALERPQAVRAVGRANAANKVNIIIPCHRVVGADGSLTGYSGGLWRKEWLLAHEARVRG
jgi:methylated-DNA-[protein]-cysteine S-methyltransferase